MNIKLDLPVNEVSYLIKLVRSQPLETVETLYSRIMKQVQEQQQPAPIEQQQPAPIEQQQPAPIEQQQPAPIEQQQPKKGKK